MAWKALRELNGYRLGVCTSNGAVIESPNAVQQNSPLTVGNTPVSYSSLPSSTGYKTFTITSNLRFEFDFQYVGDSSYSTNHGEGWVIVNGRTINYWTGGFGCGGNYTRYSDFLIFIDDENQKACVVWRYHYKYRWGQPGALYDNDSAERSDSTYDSAIYTELRRVLPIWQSVTSITGNNKTYLLAQIKSTEVNYGSPVAGASSSAFDSLTDDSLVSVLINDVIQDMSKVTVKYTIPAAEYSYIKLVYKKDEIPEDYTDGTAIDITQTSTNQTIKYIADGNTYWFVIFTDKSKSEPVEFETVEYPYLNFLKLINGSDWYINTESDVKIADAWMLNYVSVRQYGGFFDGDPKNYTFWRAYTTPISGFDTYYTDIGHEDYAYVSIYRDGQYHCGRLKCCLKTNIRINNNNNNGTYTMTADQNSAANVWSYAWYYKYSGIFEANGTTVTRATYSTVSADSTGLSINMTDTLVNCLKWLACNVRNVNLYIDGILIS